MGINGLLPLLKSIHKPCNLRKFEGKTLGVDAYGWLHRGTAACAMELAKGQHTRKFVDFAMHRVRMLQHFGVTPFLVFDGDYLPSKAATEADRNKRREESRRAGMELVKAGKTSQAYLEFQKAVDVTPEMARQLIDELKATGVQYVVAPYEADAQMVYLERKGIIQGILSEDSDLLVFGAKCLLTKLDQYGNCIEINKADFCACKEITLTGWSDKEFRQMAILSGCDYLASINGMGLKTAYRMIRKHKTVEKVLRMLSFDGKFHVPKGYLEAFYQAELTFLHQRVYCPRARSLVLHTQPESSIDEAKMPFIGSFVEDEIARGVANGNLNPMTKQPIIVQVIAKRNSMVAATPVPPRPQHLRSASSVNLKKGKPIGEFFMPKRIPLAELDPNCFTPSPSQQEALRRNSGPWTASPIPRHYLNRSVSQPVPLPQSAPPVRTQNSRHIRTPTASESRPQKRVRLCAEDDASVSPGKHAVLGWSKFFAPTERNPTVAKFMKGKGKRSRISDITIFSDDSIEEAMLNLQDADSSTSQVRVSKGKITIFEEDAVGRSSSIRLDLSQQSNSTREWVESQESVPSLTYPTSTPSSAEEPLTPGETARALSRFENLQEKFRFAAAGVFTPNSTPRAQLPPLTSSLSSRPSKIPLAIKTTTPIPRVSAFPKKSILTPLQRLGASAINRPRSPMTPPDTPAFPSRNSAPRRSLLGKDDPPFPEVATGQQKAAVEPASVPLPRPDEMENTALKMNGSGSEDLIIHDSEEEDESLSPTSGEADNSSTQPLNLAQFVYTR